MRVLIALNVVILLLAVEVSAQNDLAIQLIRKGDKKPVLIKKNHRIDFKTSENIHRRKTGTIQEISDSFFIVRNDTINYSELYMIGRRPISKDLWKIVGVPLIIIGTTQMAWGGLMLVVGLGGNQLVALYAPADIFFGRLWKGLGILPFTYTSRRFKKKDGFELEVVELK